MRPARLAIGLRPERLRIVAFAMSGAAAGLSGGLFAFKTGSVFPTYVAVGKSVDGLLMVLLGGVDTDYRARSSARSPIPGLYDVAAADRLAMAAWRWVSTIIGLVLLFPDGAAPEVAET